MSPWSTIRTAMDLALRNRPLLASRLSVAVRRSGRASAPGEWSIGGVRFSAGELAYDHRVAPVLARMRGSSYQAPVRIALEQYLSEGGVFVDVGANIGYFTALAAARVGPHGEVHAFEPVPRYLDRLRRLQRDNPDYCIVVNDLALGDDERNAIIEVAGPRDLGLNPIVPGAEDTFGKPASAGVESGGAVLERVAVRVGRFEDYARDRALQRIDLVLIDVAGYELHVLRGMGDALRERRPPIICKLQPQLLRRAGGTSQDLADWASDAGYRAFDLVTRRPVSLVMVLEFGQHTDLLFLPIDR